MNGRDGRNGAHGNIGVNGIFQILVNRGGDVRMFPEKYWLKVMGFDIVYSDDLIFEPGEVSCIKNLRVINCGKMPTPACQDVLGTIANTDLIRFDYGDAVPYKREIFEQETYQMDTDLQYYIKDYEAPTADTTFMRIAEINPFSLVTRVNKDFGSSFIRKIQIRWPVELSMLIGPRSISREEEGPFSFEVRNISGMDIGKTAAIPRILTVVIQQVSLLKDDKEFWGEQGPSQDQIEFRDEEGKTSLLSDTIVREMVIPSNDSLRFSGTFRFADPETPFYTKIRVKASVILGKRHEVFQNGKFIQYRNFDLQLAESFNRRPKAEFLLVTNSRINRSEIESWRVFMRKFHTDMMIWNISLYNGFSYNLNLGGLHFAEMLKNKIVVVLNNVFKNELNEVTNPLDLIPKKEFFQSAKSLNISTLFQGGGLNIVDILPPSDQIYDPKVNTDTLMDALKLKWKKEGDDIKKNKEKEKEQEQEKEKAKSKENIKENEKEKAKPYNDDHPNPGHPDIKSPFVGDFLKDEFRHENADSKIIEEGKDNHLKNNGTFEVITIKKTFCCGANLAKNFFVEEILKLKAKLTNLFPNHTYYFFYRCKPNLLKKTMGMCETFQWGEVEIRRGLDRDLIVDRSLAHSHKNNNLVDQVDEFVLIKLLPWDTKLDWFVRNLESNEYNIELIGKTMLSDLCEELDVYSRNSWSGLMTKKLIGQRMMILSKFIKNEHLMKILSHEAGRKTYLSIVVNYCYTLKKITSFKDYIWFNRNKRIVRSSCEKKMARFIREHFHSDRINIQLLITALINKREDLAIIFQNFIRPFHNHQRAIFNQNVDRDIDFLVDLDFLPSKNPDQNDYPQIKVDQNKFFDPITGFYNVEARQAALKAGKNNCYFDLAEMWNENVNSALFGVKEFSKLTLKEKSQL